MEQSIQEWTKKTLWKTAFKKFEVLSFTDFTWSILEYLDPNICSKSFWRIDQFFWDRKKQIPTKGNLMRYKKHGQTSLVQFLEATWFMLQP